MKKWTNNVFMCLLQDGETTIRWDQTEHLSKGDFSFLSADIFSWTCQP